MGNWTTTPVWQHSFRRSTDCSPSPVSTLTASEHDARVFLAVDVQVIGLPGAAAVLDLVFADASEEEEQVLPGEGMKGSMD